MKRRSMCDKARHSGSFLDKTSSRLSASASRSGAAAERAVDLDLEAPLETPTGSSSPLSVAPQDPVTLSATRNSASSPSSSSSAKMTKLSEANPRRSVTHPIRLLQENVMMELFQEQLRQPSPVRQNQRSRRATIATATVPSTSSTSSNNSNNNISTGRASITGSTPRPTIILYEPMAPSRLDLAAAVRAELEAFRAITTANTAATVQASQAQQRAELFTSRTSSAAPAVAVAVVDTASASVVMEGFDTAQQRECQICFDKMDALQAHVCVSCSGSFCSTCMQWYVEFKILDGEVSSKKLVCPAPECVRPLPEDLIEAFASQETFVKYQSFLKNQKTGVRFCPRAGCCAIIDEPLFCRNRKVKCTECETESCMRCGGDYHRTRLCRRVDKRYGKWKRNHNVRACPNCKSDIEKQGGCAHMKCFQCDQEFCWSCLRSWDDHDETLCIPLAFYHSKSRKYGCWAPLRFVTKSVVLSVASVVVVAGAGVAVVVLPPLIGYHLVRDSYRRNKHLRRGSYVMHTSEAMPQH